MKKIYTIIASALLLTFSFGLSTAYAQAPEKMSYQAVVRDASNNLTTNQAVGMQISILQGGATGTAVYVETQTPTTNANGLVSLEIGTGTVVSGTFNTIDWANDTYFIKTETDPTGGISYTITGTTQLMSVPYALHSKTADSVTGTVNYTETDPIFGTSIANGITAADTVNWNNHTIDTDTQLDSTGVTTLGFVAGSHTANTNIDSTGITTLGYVAGAHTVDTDTQLDSTGVATLGFVAGSHTANTNIDSAGIATLGYTAGVHTINTDTQLDSTGVATLGFVAGAHTANTNIDSTGIATLGYVAGAKTVDTQLDSTGITALGFVAGGGSGWGLTGDASTVDGTNFIGTTDNVPVNFKVNNLKAGRIGTTTDASVFLGYEAGLNDDLTNNQNTFVGYQTGKANTTGVSNVATGYQALQANTTGFQNTANGYQALQANTTGISNVANGTVALLSNTTGNNNVANGTAALRNNTTGNNNTANGLFALFFNTAGNNNTALGYDAGRGVLGSGNVMLGYQAGMSTGSGGVFLGNNAGQNETGNNTLYIDNSNTATPLIKGDFATNELTVNGELTVTDTLKLLSGAAAGRVLTSDANGVATWQAAAGGSTDPFYLGQDTLGGIVYYIYKDASGTQHGLIVNKTESLAVWQASGTLTNADRTEDGAYNTGLMTSSAAATYVTGLGAGWYLPSIDELGLLYYNRFSANRALRAGSFTLLSSTASYWSSTETSPAKAYFFGFFNGNATNVGKNITLLVRAVRAF